MKTFVAAGSINAFLAVAFGAFGAHGLKGKISAESLAVYETAAHYQLTHALAILAVGILISLMPNAKKQLAFSGWLFLAGIVLFSGSLYALAITDIKRLGAITPFGGLCFLVAWAILVAASLRRG